ncbi:cytochrome c oxidase subunit 3 [Portibacter lacus]|uniref:Cytochrome oxidase subunit III n=1 Tax=Portibacter lacus TaxID=1099794 RepID=A0AA37WGR7_9BACT|nr:cytochrome c oxidase subunit 3 [Portibacter lacus]GLR20158.1 cytochrome oxidase subunit III [Portibacter lacus]
MAEERAFLIHPKQIIITLVIAAVTMLFIAFSISYLYNRMQSGIPPVKLPNLFYFNTLFLLSSSYTLHLANKAYLSDLTERYKVLIGVTIISSIIFLVLQFFAWKQMINMNIFVDAANTGSYMYLLSATHFVHVIGGLPFLIVFFVNALKKMKSPVSVLIYFSDPDKKRDLQLLTTYWHYIDILWIYLVLFFLLNYWIQ